MKNPHRPIARLALAALLLTALPAQRSHWADAKPRGDKPPARYGAAMASDPVRGRVVLFGGYAEDGKTLLTGTWEFDGHRWRERTPAASPDPRFTPGGMAWDPVNEDCLLFGGSTGKMGTGTRNDTWAWDGSGWTKRDPAASPPPRFGQAMASDTARGRVVLFGGSAGGAVHLDDTWEWDGADWRQRSPATVPPKRYIHAMAYDSARQRTVLFGGTDALAGPHLADTWEWNGTDWTRREPAASPSARHWHSACYDPESGHVVVFGGRDAPKTFLGDTWLWDGSEWRRLDTKEEPRGRIFATSAWDPVTRRSLLFGGDGGGVVLDDTWKLFLR